MGSGKTTVGRHLARILRWEFFDTDEIIMQKLKMNISEIFAGQGEGFFREREIEVVRCLGARKPGTCVIATGGGVMLREENRAALSKNGLLIFLDVTAGEVYRRLKDNRDRPLLSVKNPLQKIEQLLRERRPYYLKADVLLKVGTKSPEEIASEIIITLLKH